MKNRESSSFVASMNTLIVYKQMNENAIKYARRVGEYLLVNKYTDTLYVEQSQAFEGIITEIGCIKSFDKIIHATLINLVVVIGGDGTILWANYLFTGYSKPKFLTFNLGTLGYLSYYRCDQFKEVFYELFAKENKSILIEKRSTLDVKFITSNPDLIDVNLNCLNEIVFDKSDSKHMIKTHIFINDEYFTKIRSDGILISTSTGSTAYNLSCMGSIIHSDADSMIMNAISPFSLSFRPIIFTKDAEIQIVLDQSNYYAEAKYDGLNSYKLKAGEGIKIKISDKYLHLIVLENIISNPMKNWINKMTDQLGYNSSFINEVLGKEPKF